MPTRESRAGEVQAHEMVRLAADTIQSVADRLTDPAQQRSFLAWSKVQGVQADLDRLRRA